MSRLESELLRIFPFSSGHVQTMFGPIFRPKPSVHYVRQRMDTSDGDFVDLDWSRGGSEDLVVILHGLEGHSRRKYVRGMARAARLSGFDVLAKNFRGCSEEPNRTVGMYHSGWTQDLHEVLEMVSATRRYARVHLVGFSLGGNVILKYLGENPARVPQTVHSAVTFSVPCDLEDSSKVLARRSRAVYMRYLLDQLKKKIIKKSQLFPGTLNISGLDRMQTFLEFDERFTAPLHGFAGAKDYWKKSSSRQFLHAIRKSTLIVNALNDPFLGPDCYPYAEVQENAHLTLLTPETGGHVGFVGHGRQSLYWSECVAMDFVAQSAVCIACV